MNETEVFNFYASYQGFNYKRVIVKSEVFDYFRACVRDIIAAVSDVEEYSAENLNRQLRYFYLNLISSPLEFNQERFAVLGESVFTPVVLKMLGEEVASKLHAARTFSTLLVEAGNPILRYCEELMSILDSEQKGFRFFLDKSLHSEIKFKEFNFNGSDYFLSSLRSYSRMLPFDVLIKCGPLKTFGFGKTHDAFVSSPRYSEMVHVTWDMTSDDDSFGMNPVAAWNEFEGRWYQKCKYVRNFSEETVIDTLTKIDSRLVSSINFKSDLDFDELYVSPDKEKIYKDGKDLVECCFVQTDLTGGYLFPLGFKTLTFLASAESSCRISYRYVGRDLDDSMRVLLIVQTPESYFGAASASSSIYSKKWKAALSDELFKSELSIISALQEKGIKLANLHNALKGWSKAPTTVIHAPQSKSHFLKLVSCLTFSIEPETNWNKWCEKAWTEIVKSRVLAIDHGRTESLVLREGIIDALNSYDISIWGDFSSDDIFDLQIDLDGKGSFAIVSCCPIFSISDGFFVPREFIQKYITRDEVIKWWN